MSDVKNIIIKVIPSKVANEFVKKNHYSGKVVNNSNLHFGAFLNNTLHGVMSFGSPLDKSKVIGLVHTKENKPCLWNEMLELNRMAFDSFLPKNSESRSIAIAIKLLKKNAPHIKWILSFSDATQCGDGVIYRASGFHLTNIKTNNQIWEAPSGETFNDTSLRPGIGGKKEIEKAKQVFSRTSLTDGRSKQQQQLAKNIISRTTTTKGKHIVENGASSMKQYKDAGWKPKEGFQLRYIYIIDKSCHLNTNDLPFSEIDKLNAGMYRGEKISVKERKHKSVKSIVNDAVTNPSEESGAEPTLTHHE